MFLTYIPHGTAEYTRTTRESRELKVGGEKWLCNIYLLLSPLLLFFEGDFFHQKLRKWKKRIKNSMSEWKVNSARAFSNMIVNWSEKFSLLSHAIIRESLEIWIEGNCCRHLRWESSMQISSFQKARISAECCWQIPTPKAIIISQSQRITFLIKNAWQELTSNISTVLCKTVKNVPTEANRKTF